MSREFYRGKAVRNKSRRKRLGIGFGVLLIIVLAVATADLMNELPADETAMKAIHSDSIVGVTRTDEGYFFDGPAEDTAIIFYPGAKVVTEAYAPMMKKLAAEGADVFLVDMPLRIAFLDMDAADGIRAKYNYAHWYMAGHSLGGATAATYLEDHQEDYEGLILMAAKPSMAYKEGVSAIMLYGTEDGHITYLEDIGEDRPQDFTKVKIIGGNHAQFGNYGKQPNDGEAKISREKQQEIAAAKIHEYLAKHAQ